jgi:hypothetical protein
LAFGSSLLGERVAHCSSGAVAVRALSSAVGTDLCWIQPKGLGRHFELRAGDDVLAILRFETLCGSLARAESADGSWTFKRVGFFKPRVTVRKAGEEVNLAVYTPRWTGREGALEFPDGRVFSWKQTNFWAARYQITDAVGNLLASFQSGIDKSKLSDIFKTQARVEIDLRGRALPELPLLVLLGWYLIVLQENDAAAAGAAAAAAAAT